MVKAVIFDCFGVLVSGAFEEVYSRAGGDPVKDKEFIDELINSANLGLISVDEMRDKVSKQIGISIDRWQEEIARIQLPSQELLDYVKELKPNYKVAILSNANVGTLQRKFTKEQLDLFDTVVVSAEVHHIKPEPEIYQLVAKKLSVEPKECIFTDDNPGFCEAAEKAGMKAICYENFKQFKASIEPFLRQV